MRYNKCYIGGEVMTKLENDLEMAHTLIQEKNKYREYYGRISRTI